jgi:hypothetical protein
MNICDYCKHNFSTNQSLKRHDINCKEKQKQIYEKGLFEQYEQQFKKQHEHFEQQQKQLKKQIECYEQQLKEQQIQYEKQLEKLELQIQKLENQIFEIAKQPKQQFNNHNNSNNTTTNNNQKTLNILNQLAPYDLTVEMVQETLEKYALEKVFKDGPNSIADFVVEKILTDSVTRKPKLIATDRSRGVFKYKDPDGNVHIDNKLTRTTDILQKPLFQANDQILLEILKRHNFDIDDFTRRIFNENSDLLNSINKEKLSARLSRRLESEYVPGSENSLE